MTALPLKVEIPSLERTIKVTFYSDRAAADYIAKNAHRAYFDLLEDTFDVNSYPLTSAALFPTCHHGLSLDLCNDPIGPNHYGWDRPEDDFAW